MRVALGGRPPAGVVPMAHAGALDAVFALGVLRAAPGPDGAWSPWFGLPAYVLAVTFPLLLLVLVVVALTGPPAPAGRGRRGLDRWHAATLGLAGLGFAMYLSPWGRTAVAAVLQS